MTARDAIAQAGGLHSIADLADRWGMTPQWVRQLVRRDGFPAPVLTAGGRELWLGDGRRRVHRSLSGARAVPAALSPRTDSARR